MDEIALLIKTLLVMVVGGVALIVMVYLSYLIIPLLIIAFIGMIAYNFMRLSRGY
jgi:hypothetical protein